MNIVSTQYNLHNKALEIYLSGCYGDCYNCHNPELKDFNKGNHFRNEIANIKNKIYNYSNLIHNIWILGGEPLDQDLGQLECLLSILKESEVKVWLWSRYELNEIPEEIRKYCDYIKCGQYIEQLKTDINIQYGVKLASSNQNIYKIKGEP